MKNLIGENGEILFALLIVATLILGSSLSTLQGATGNIMKTQIEKMNRTP